MIISVRPSEPLKVWWIVMDLPISRSRTKPTKSEPFDKNGRRATFRHPHAAREFLVTLSDESEYRVRVAPHGSIAVWRVTPPRREEPRIPANGWT